MANTKTMFDSVQELLEASEGWMVAGPSPEGNKLVIEFPSHEQAETFSNALCRLLTDHHDTRAGFMRFTRPKDSQG